MSDTNTDWSDLFDDLMDWIDDLWPGDGGDPGIRCAVEVGRRFPRGSAEYTAAMTVCQERFGGGSLGPRDPTPGIERDITDFVEDLLGDLEGQLGGVIGGIDDVLSGVFDGLDDVFGDFGGALNGQLDDFLRPIGEVIQTAVRGMSRAISESLGAAVDTVNRVVSDVVQQIERASDSAIGEQNVLLRKVIDNIDVLTGHSIKRIEDVTTAVFGVVESTVEDIRDTLSSAFNDITDHIGNQIEQATALQVTATDSIFELGETNVRNAEAIKDVIVKEIDESISALTDAASGSLSVVREGLDNLQSAVTSGLTGLGPVLTDFVVGPAAAATKGLVEGITGSLNQAVLTPQEDLTRLFECMGLPKEAGDKARAVINCIFPTEVLFGPFLQNLLVMWSAISIGMGWAQQLSNAAGIKALQDIQPAFPIALPDPSMVQEMLNLGTVEEATAIDLLQRNGFSTDNARRILDIRRRVPDVGIIQVWFLRGFVTRQQALQLLTEIGFQQPDNDRLLEMAFFVPPVSDLITMAVREVFSPDIARRFGQFEDFPKDFARYAKQQGISEEWAQNYWAAHWALPSVQMGFEMLHRKVISKSDLELLLRSQDVMPFWRDKLIAISYSPLTRVDVRRMHKMGVLDDRAVKKAYQDIGYDDTNAELLLRFTKELNAPPEGATPEQLDELTRSAITNLYGAGTLGRQDAFELLQAIGVGSAAAIIFLDMVDLRNEADQRAAETQLILNQAKAGIIRFSEAEDKLNALGLEPLEVQRALTKLQAAQDATVKLPSTQQLDDMLRADIIPSVVYLDTMLRLGYSTFWAERLMTLAKKTS